MTAVPGQCDEVLNKLDAYIEALRTALAEAERQRAALAGYEAEEAVRKAVEDEPDEIGPKKAAAIAGRDYTTMIRWARWHGIGWQVGTRWVFSRRRLEAFMVKNRPD